MRKLLLILLALPLFACTTPDYFIGRVLQQERRISPLYDVAQTITVKKNMVFYDSMEPAEGMYLAEGTYTLIGQDDEYRYFECPTMLERRRFKHGDLWDQWLFRGGIAFARDKTNKIQAAVFVDGREPGLKGLTWELGDGFLKREGKLWTKSF